MFSLKFKNLILTIIVASSFSACGLSKVKYTERTQLITMSPSKEMKMGLNASEGIKKENKATLDKDKALLKRVQTIGKKIAKVANQPDFKWEFHTISKDVLNAFCLPGGKVYVYTGIAKVTANDDQLATVMSHEIAHAIARHGAERVSMGQITSIGQKVLALAVKTKAPQYDQAFQKAYGYGANVGLMLPFSRKHEMEADKIGLILMTKSGYDTKESAKFWINMKRASGNTGKSKSDFFSTHPSDDKRIAQINEYNRNH